MKSGVARVGTAYESARKKAHRKPRESPTVGKIFFGRGGTDYVCSGGMIPSKWHNPVPRYRRATTNSPTGAT